jgi:hypothetical protein
MRRRSGDMNNAIVVQYTTRPEHAEENERLIREVFSELAEHHPAGLRYSALRLADGVSFVHFGVLEADENPLASSPAFARFQAGIADRVASGPTPSSGSVIGSFSTLSS